MRVTHITRLRESLRKVELQELQNKNRTSVMVSEGLKEVQTGRLAARLRYFSRHSGSLYRLRGIMSLMRDSNTILFIIRARGRYPPISDGWG